MTISGTWPSDGGIKLTCGILLPIKGQSDRLEYGGGTRSGSADFDMFESHHCCTGISCVQPSQLVLAYFHKLLFFIIVGGGGNHVAMGLVS